MILRTMRNWLFLAAFIAVFGCILCSGQTPDTSPTPETVTISRAAAVKCLENGDKVTALESELKANAAAIADLKALVADLKATIAGLSGEKTQLEATLVRYNALIDILIKNARPKKIGLINLF